MPIAKTSFIYFSACIIERVDSAYFHFQLDPRSAEFGRRRRILCISQKSAEKKSLYCRLAVDTYARILFLLIIFSVLMTWSARSITSMIQKRLDKRDMILDRVTLKQGKTHCGTRLINNGSSSAYCYWRKCGSRIKSAVWRGIHWDARISDV